MITNLVNNLKDITTNKPTHSFFIIQSSAAAAFLSELNAWTNILGFVAGIFGVLVGYFSLISAYRKYKNEMKTTTHKKHHK